MMFKLILLAFFLISLSFSITESEFREDAKYLEKVNERLRVLDEKVNRGEIDSKVVDELNSYGYPLNNLKRKYLLEDKEEYRRFYREASNTFEKLMYIKRGVLANFVKEEIEALGIKVCKVVAEGEDRKKITVFLEDPHNEEDIVKIMTQTQLQYAQFIGVNTINFEPCDKGILYRIKSLMLNMKNKLLSLLR